MGDITRAADVFVVWWPIQEAWIPYDAWWNQPYHATAPYHRNRGCASLVDSITSNRCGVNILSRLRDDDMSAMRSTDTYPLFNIYPSHFLTQLRIFFVLWLCDFFLRMQHMHVCVGLSDGDVFFLNHYVHRLWFRKSNLRKPCGLSAWWIFVDLRKND